MEMSVQGKASSDFSIEKILSEDPKSARPSDAPSWLCCTRYRPPRLPRTAGAGGAHRGRRAGRHARVPFTAAQAQTLEAAYARAPYLAPPALRALAAALQLRDDRIKIWFQNRRARERRVNCSSIAPPHGVALPPTLFTTPPTHLTTPPTRLTTPPTDLTTPPAGIIIRIGSTGDYIRGDAVHGNKVQEDYHELSQEAQSSALCLAYKGLEDRNETRPDSPLDVESVDD